jgi:hypothetical protein
MDTVEQDGMRRLRRHEPMWCPRLHQLRDYWQQARGDRPIPQRRDIDPLKVPRLLPYLTLAEVFRDPLRFRYRLIGTQITEMAGRDATGRWLDETLYGTNLERILWGYRTCVETREPVAIREAVQFVAKDWITIEVLMLPIGDPDGTVRMVLNGLDIVADDAIKPPRGISYTLDWRAPA